MEHHHVVVIGAGFSGLGLAVRLRQAGITDFAVLERAEEIGGTWRDNAYPGAACDVQSALYSYSFAPNPAWTRTFAPQPEIFEYLKDVVERFGLRPHLRLGAELHDAEWDDAAGHWRITTSRGDMTADVLVSGTGTLSDPAVPSIPGLDTFAGPAFHSARWRHDVELTGRRVAVIGTGASAIQFVPEIQPVAGHLSVFQRTPTWVIPRHDREIPALARTVFRHVPFAQQLVRSQYYWQREALVPGLTRNPALVKPVQLMAQRHLSSQVADPALRAKLTPDFALGCKRILISNDWYPALTQPNVDVVTDGITAVTEHGVVTADGTLHEADVIIFGTGFQATTPPVAHRITGRTGRTLAQKWDGSMRAHKCTSVAEFPNFFILNGPNLGVGHTSMVYMIESQAAYIVAALQQMAADGTAVLEVDPAAETEFVEWIRAQTRNSVWTNGGCASWYLDRNGDNTTLWPGQSFSFRRITSTFDDENYLVRQAARVPAEVAV